MRGFILIACMALVGQAWPQSTQSTTQPTTQPSEIKSALDLMKMGQNRDAIKKLEAYLATFPKGKMQQPEQAVASHCLAVAHFRVNQQPKAREWMDKAWAVGFTSKSLALNRAIMDVKLQGTLVRGMKQLESAIAEYGVDEISVDAFGYAIFQANRSSVTRGDAAKVIDSYTKFNSQLESTKGMRHYGNQWMTAEEYQKTMNPPGYADDHRIRVSLVARYQAEVNQNTAKLAQAKRDAALNQNDSTKSAAREAQIQLNASQTNLNNAQRDLAALEARIPAAKFAPPITLYDPDLDVAAR